MRVRRRLHLQVGEYDWQSSMGCARLFVFGILVVVTIGVVGSTWLDGINPRDVADIYRDRIWFFHYLPQPILTFIAAVTNWNALRYMIAPLSAIICIFIAGAFYVQDIYALPTFGHALRYVVASMFGIGYPTLVIDKGEKQLGKNEINLIDKIGGPGFVVIEPGNAAMFRRLRGPSAARVSEVYFLEPFEKLASAINLDEQHRKKDLVFATTRDGIRVAIKDIHFRYRICQAAVAGVPVPRSLDNPYPFAEEAIRNMTFNLMVQDNGLETWHEAIERSVTGTITDYISSHSIDHLTAPRTGDYNPRLEISSQFLLEIMKTRLAGLGAELLWVDVGHIEVEDDSVDETRTSLWSAEWAGDAAEVRAFGDAIRQAYQELGRAEAQADLIMSIAGALTTANIGNGNQADNIRRILLARTSQLLDAMSQHDINLDDRKQPPDGEE